MIIPHITECASLCKNDLDPNDKSDSASVQEFVSSSSITNWSARCEHTTGLSVPSSVNSSDFNFLEDQVLSIFHSEQLDESVHATGLIVLSYFSVCGLRRVRLSCLIFFGLSDAVEDGAAGVLSLHRETKFIIGFDFAVTLSSPYPCCVLFDITSEHTAELKWLMLDKHKR